MVLLCLLFYPSLVGVAPEWAVWAACVVARTRRGDVWVLWGVERGEWSWTVRGSRVTTVNMVKEI